MPNDKLYKLIRDKKDKIQLTKKPKHKITRRIYFRFSHNIIGKFEFNLGSNWGVKFLLGIACRTESVSFTKYSSFYIINKLYLVLNGVLLRRIFGTPPGSNPGGASKKTTTPVGWLFAFSSALVGFLLFDSRSLFLLRLGEFRVLVNVNEINNFGNSRNRPRKYV